MNVNHRCSIELTPEQIKDIMDWVSANATKDKRTSMPSINLDPKQIGSITKHGLLRKGKECVKKLHKLDLNTPASIAEESCLREDCRVLVRWGIHAYRFAEELAKLFEQDAAEAQATTD